MLELISLSKEGDLVLLNVLVLSIFLYKNIYFFFFFSFLFFFSPLFGKGLAPSSHISFFSRFSYSMIEHNILNSMVQ